MKEVFITAGIVVAGVALLLVARDNMPSGTFKLKEKV